MVRITKGSKIHETIQEEIKCNIQDETRKLDQILEFDAALVLYYNNTSRAEISVSLTTI